MSLKQKKLFRLVLSAMFLALAMVLPIITGQMQQIGKALCPMHMPVLLCGFFCGPLYGLAVGAIAPLLRFLIFAMPPIYPTGIAMCFELAVYGLSSGVLYKLLPKKPVYVYVSLIASMIFGRIVWGIVRAIMYGLGGAEFGIKIFIADAVTNSIPGIIIQIVFIPLIVIALKKALPAYSENKIEKQ